MNETSEERRLELFIYARKNFNNLSIQEFQKSIDADQFSKSDIFTLGVIVSLMISLKSGLLPEELKDE